MMAGRGILLDENNDLKISGSSLVIGDSETQEVALIIQMNQGELKSVPELGPNLIQLKKISASRFDLEQRLQVHLAIDRKDWFKVKGQVKEIISIK